MRSWPENWLKKKMRPMKDTHCIFEGAFGWKFNVSFSISEIISNGKKDAHISMQIYYNLVMKYFCNFLFLRVNIQRKGYRTIND